MINPQQVYNGVLALNNDSSNPFHYEIGQDGKIYGFWNWKNAILFQPGAVTSEVRDYVFIVTLDFNKMKWHELDKSSESTVSAGKGKISFEKSGFAGKQNNKHFEIALGHDRNSGDTGVIVTKFDTLKVKTPVREYLKSIGFKKAMF